MDHHGRDRWFIVSYLASMDHHGRDRWFIVSYLTSMDHHGLDRWFIVSYLTSMDHHGLDRWFIVSYLTSMDHHGRDRWFIVSYLTSIDHHGRDRWFIVSYLTSMDHHGLDRLVAVLCNQCLPLLRLCVRVPLVTWCTRYNIFYKVCQFIAAGRCFSLVTLVSSTNKTDLHDIVEILLKMASNTITLTPNWASSWNYLMHAQYQNKLNNRNGTTGATTDNCHW
jgi:hypothetical protein